jgi:hypothetical protein
VTAFANGVYLVYNIKGNVRLNVHRTSGPNALLQGVFVGGAVPPPVSNRPLTLSARVVSQGQLMVVITGDSGQRFRLESSPDFRGWTELTSGALVGSSSEIQIPIARASVRMFLRAVNTR